MLYTSVPSLNRNNFRLFALMLGTAFLLACRTPVPVAAPAVEEAAVSQTEYLSVPGDPMQTRIYTLENGLTVYLSRNAKAPQISGVIGVRAGSTYDPADATGLAHYLEHMLFKGTDRMGTRDFSREAPLLNEIAETYEAYRDTEDSLERALVYRKIDSLSQEAAKFAVPNAYDQTLSALGASAANAFTSDEMTAYFSSFPANKLEPWLMLESERFRNPVMRLFHTELEAVYEEKNISLDDEGDQVDETLNEALFPTHPYGQQTVIGTIEHLKNPSIREIEAYYRRYYVPANMVLCLAGDLNYDATIEMVRSYLGKWEARSVPEPPQFPKEDEIRTPVIRVVTGPGPETVTLGFRVPGVNHPDYPVLQMIDLLLMNAGSGLIDINLLQKQRIQEGYSIMNPKTQYGIHELGGSPRQGQTLEEVQALLLGEIDRLGKGDFELSRLEGVVNNALVSELRENDNNFSRALKCLTAYCYRLDYAKQVVASLDRVRAVSKEDIMRAVDTYYGDRYAVVYKRQGEMPQQVKVPKPAITPIPVQAPLRSEWEDKVLGKEVPPLSPVFVDYRKEIQFDSLEAGIPFWYVQNAENELFSYSWIWEVGTDQSLNLGLLADYMDYLGTDSLSAEEMRRAWAQQGTQVSLQAGRRQVTVSVSGLKRYEKQALALLKDWLNAPKADTAALSSLKADILQDRANARKNPNRIRSHLQFFGLYGPRNPRKHIIPADSLARIGHEDLMQSWRKLQQIQHKVLYFGPATQGDALARARSLALAKGPLAAPKNAPVFTYFVPDSPTVYVVDYDMVQTMVFWLSPMGDYTDARRVRMDLYNEYLDGGAGSLMFQRIREARALAYATYAETLEPYSPEMGFFRMALIGTQQDKLPEALPAVVQLLDSMPLTAEQFALARQNLLLSMEAERITDEDILFGYEDALRYTGGTDKRKALHQFLQAATLEDFKQFYQEEIQGQRMTTLIMGQWDNLDKEAMARYGKVVKLELSDLFGE